MRSAHLTLAIFCHFLLASLVFHLSLQTAGASPLNGANQKQEPISNVDPKPDQKPVQQVAVAAAAVAPVAVDSVKSVPVVESKEVQQKSAPVSEQKKPVAAEPKLAEPKKLDSPQEARSSAAGQQKSESLLTKKDSDTVQPSHVTERKDAAPTSPLDSQTQPVVKAPPVEQQQASEPQVQKQQQPQKELAQPVPLPAALVSSAETSPKASPEPAVKSEARPAPAAEASRVRAPVGELAPVPATSTSSKPLQVKGGLGPLHLLATTLCRYKPERRDSVQDDSLRQLYARRLAVRRQLFDFMSLKFANLEKLNTRLGHGLQVAPAVSVAVGPAPADSKSDAASSHGWPVVGKCTAYDLRLMGEAAYCEHAPEVAPALAPAAAPERQRPAAESAKVVAESPEEKPAAITSNQHVVASRLARSVYSQEAVSSFLAAEEKVAAAAAAPAETATSAASPKQLNATLECRRNALRYSKALFNHLAEDQRQVSESWPELYAALTSNDCATRRAIDIFTALSGFRTESTSIRRDNLEFAFAMDDLRAKVLENDVTTPLTFDRTFIEVEQFLQQSVRLMLASIQPKKAAITSARYRSLMYDASPSQDEQCIDLHQRLLARNHPSDCNPTEFGQLPDVLRMTASSLELWSIERELSQRLADQSAVATSDDVNECVANLVSSG